MTAIHRRSLICPIGIPVTLATVDDLNGTSDGTQWYDITGAQRVLIWQIDSSTGGDGGAGIDCIEVSHDGGSQWYADGTGPVPATGMLCSADDDAGDVLVAGTLNVAGVEPATIAGGMFKFGPFEGPTLIRCGRDSTNRGSGGTGTDWTTTAPAVVMIPIGMPSGGGAIAAEV
jgi:hypothetical protein